MSAAIHGRTILAVAAVAASAVCVAAAMAGGTAPGDVELDARSVDLAVLDRVPAGAWENLAKKRVYFGHQSVGYNVLAGVEDIRRAKPQVRLEIVETSDLAKLTGPVFAHSRVGANCDPDSKIRDFVRRIESAGPGALDIAFFKFCYVDVTAATPVEPLFAQYRDVMARLEQRFPATKFVHFTVPLTTPETGLKAGIKRLVGRLPWKDEDNIARRRFNDLLRAEYAGKRPLVDLAAAESTLPDGTAVVSGRGDDRSPCLPRCYTYDGGHLNETGRIPPAREMLRVLAEIAQ